jgi:antitoxin VapB
MPSADKRWRESSGSSWTRGAGVAAETRAKKTAKVFWTGRSHAVWLPKEFRFDSETVSVRGEGQAVILEPTDGWPEGYVESFTGVPRDFSRPPQRKVEKRAALR